MAGIVMAPDGLLPDEERLLKRLPGGGDYSSVAELSEGCLKDEHGNIYWGYAHNRTGRRAAEHRYRHKIKTLTAEQAAKLASGEEKISGGAAVSWYVRKTGSDNNGGSSASATPDQTGTDGSSVGTTTFTSASANFQAGDVGKGLNVAGTIYRVVTRVSATQVTVDRNLANASGQTWNLGGCLLTIGKLLQTSAAIMQNGDTLWIGAGTYRETISLSMTALTATGYIRGDVTGANTGDAGMVIITAYTTNDKTAPSATTLLNLNSKNYLSFQNLVFIGGNAHTITAGATSTNIQILDCTFLQAFAKNNINATAAFNTALTWTIDRCFFHVGQNNNPVVFTLTRGTGADYDSVTLIQNSVFLSGASTSVFVQSTGAGANFGGGVRCRNLFVLGAGLRAADSNLSTSIPCSIVNSIVLNSSGAAALQASTSGEVTEDYNYITSPTPRTNVSAGTHSISDGSYAPLIEIGQSYQQGFQYRPFGVPMAGSPLLGFGNDGNQTSYDLYNRPRPAGGASASPAVGAFERGNTFGKETGTVHTGSNAISITGPGYQDFDIPVDAASTTVSIYMRYDSTYAGTRPQFQVLNGDECGVASQTVTATTSALNAWEQESITFTPTSKGIVTVRVISNDTNGGGHVYADTFAVA